MSAARVGASSELRLRVLSSLVLGGLALLSAWAGGWVVVILWLGAAIMVGAEWIAMARLEPRSRLEWLMAASVSLILLMVVLFSRGGGVGTMIATVLVVPCLALLALMLGAPGTIAGGLWAVGAVLYAAPIAVAPVVLRLGHAEGMWLLLWMFAVVWTTDVTAYFVGRAVGGPKLWPKVSPKKTWSGFLGGLAGAVLAGTALAHFAAPRAGYEIADVLTIVVLSGMASVASQAGDLAESAMKRHFGAKDSGRLIPGHGGFMDRLDGFAAVAILICVLIPLAQVSLWTVAP